MTLRSGLYRLVLPVVAVLALILTAAAGGRGIAAPAGGVAAASECPSCDDFNPCTVDSCDAANGTCRHDPLNCDDGNSCTDDFCVFDPAHPDAGGGCAHATRPAGAACDDGLICTIGDICNDTGACVGQIQPAGTACDDGNSCTGPDTCDDAGQCAAQGTSEPGSPCDDGSLCTIDDACVATDSGSIVCQGVLTRCDDGDPCTQDTCDPVTGNCGAAPVTCDDGNACTLDACDPATGSCSRANVPGPCDDGNLCTVDDACSGGNCLGSPRDCDDGNPCTADSCDPLTGCQHTPTSGGSCDDGNACTTSDTCSNGTCGGTSVSCDDGNPCTTDSCNPATGCQHTPNNDACDDGNVCTTSDTCSNGTCQGTAVSCDDGRDCTIDSCHPTVGCVHAYDARLPDADSDGVPDSCDNCPGAANRLQLDCNANGVGDACDPSLYDVRVLTNTAEGKGSGEVIWTTVCETDLRGFNVLMIDPQGGRTRLNTVPIPCSSCITGLPGVYSTLIPKHKSGRNIYLEVLHRTSVNLIVGPAVKE